MAKELSSYIENWVPENSKVIDFGCGDGSLLKKLINSKNILGYGVEINDKKISHELNFYNVEKGKFIEIF